MSADVPAHEAEFGVLYASRLERTGDFNHTVKGYIWRYWRLGLGRLLQYGRGNRFPCLAYADFRRIDGLLQDGIRRSPFLERLHCATFQLAVSVGACDAAHRCITSFKAVKRDFEVLVGRLAQFAVKDAAHAVFAVLCRHACGEIVFQAFDDCCERPFWRLHAIYAHQLPSAALGCPVIASERTVFAAGENPEAVVALFCAGEIGRKGNGRSAASDDFGTGERKDGRAVRLRQIAQLLLDPSVRISPRKFNVRPHACHRRHGEHRQHQRSCQHHDKLPLLIAKRIIPKPSFPGNAR